jgi:hypothetical protein
VVGAALAVALPAGLAVIPARADDAAFSSYGADASATGVHLLSYTNALTNFATGFVDNSYPLASTHLDAGPASQAVASVADTGPLGVTAEGQVKPNLEMISPGSGELVSQPQYAVARYPGTPSASLDNAGAVARSDADSNGAQAVAAFMAGSADNAVSSVRVDPIIGTVIGEGHSHVNRFTVGGGLLDLANVDVVARVTVEGTKVTPYYAISVGSATVNGMPVQVTDKGVVVQGAPLPGSDAMTQVVNEQLNGALAAAGLGVSATAPKIVTDAGQATVEVSGVHVHYTAPNPDPSVPTLSYDFIVGEARAFSFGVPATPTTDSLSPSAELPTTITDVQGATDLGDISGAVGDLSPQIANTAAPRRIANPLTAVPAAFRRPRPTWLVPIYVIWQLLMLITGGALVWSRGDHG